jgi:cell division septal protein FtsQ
MAVNQPGRRPRPGGRPSAPGVMPDYDGQIVSPFLRLRQEERLRHSRRSRRAMRFLPAAALTALVGLLAGSFFAARWYMTHSSRFTVRRIALTPTDHAAQGELRRRAQRYVGKNIFQLYLLKIESELEAVRWVRKATVKRVLPDRLFCAVEEREPRGLALVRGRVQMIDEEGTPIDLYTGGEAMAGSHPIFTGLDEASPARAREQVARGYDLQAWLDETHPGLSKEISEIDLSRKDRIGLVMNNGGPVVRLHPSDYGANLDRWLAMREYLATHLGDGAYVDLRFRDRIAFQPLPARRDASVRR